MLSSWKTPLFKIKFFKNARFYKALGKLAQTMIKKLNTRLACSS
ncbi:hypothetical protein FH5_04792 [Priestia endophytica]|nr:hypothetical protein FH5_04792 [Priestia endophytica]